MPGFLLHVEAGMTCPHTAKVATAPTQTRVLVSTLPVATVANQLLVAGCLFQVPVPGGTKPQPCVRVQWAMVAARVRVMGQAVLLQAAPPPGPGSGTCQSVEPIPAGPPNVAAMQVRVAGM